MEILCGDVSPVNWITGEIY